MNSQLVTDDVSGFKCQFPDTATNFVRNLVGQFETSTSCFSSSQSKINATKTGCKPDKTHLNSDNAISNDSFTDNDMKASNADSRVNDCVKSMDDMQDSKNAIIFQYGNEIINQRNHLRPVPAPRKKKSVSADTEFTEKTSKPTGFIAGNKDLEHPDVTSYKSGSVDEELGTTKPTRVKPEKPSKPAVMEVNTAKLSSDVNKISGGSKPAVKPKRTLVQVLDSACVNGIASQPASLSKLGSSDTLLSMTANDNDFQSQTATPAPAVSESLPSDMSKYGVKELHKIDPCEHDKPSVVQLRMPVSPIRGRLSLPGDSDMPVAVFRMSADINRTQSDASADHGRMSSGYSLRSCQRSSSEQSVTNTFGNGQACQLEGSSSTEANGNMVYSQTTVLYSDSLQLPPVLPPRKSPTSSLKVKLPPPCPPPCEPEKGFQSPPPLFPRKSIDPTTELHLHVEKRTIPVPGHASSVGSHLCFDNLSLSNDIELVPEQQTNTPGRWTDSPSVPLVTSRSLVDLRPQLVRSVDMTLASHSLRDSSTSSSHASRAVPAYETVTTFIQPRYPQSNIQSTKTAQSSHSVSPDIDPDVYSNLYTNEPLYQIYHQNAIVRDVISQNTENGSESDYDESSDDYETYVKRCLGNILQRTIKQSDMEQQPLQQQQQYGTMEDDESGSGGGVDDTECDTLTSSLVDSSTLRSADQFGASFKQLWCEMAGVKDNDFLQSMSLEERRMQESQFELISSEVSYLKSMNILVNHFMAAFSARLDRDKEQFMTRDDFNRLFSNARAVRNASAKLVCALEKLWVSSCILDPSALGERVSIVAEQYFDVYVIYCSNAVYQDRKLHDLLRHNEFQTFLARLESSSCCQLLPLSSFLALPMQRITRLPLLISSICRRLETTGNGTVPCELSRCLQVLQKLVKLCNEGARKMINIEQLMEVEKVLDFKLTKRVPLVSESRYLVKKGMLTQLCKPSQGLRKKTKRSLHLFLFKDILIITKRKSFRERPFEVIEHSPRINVHAEVISEDELVNRMPVGSVSNTNNIARSLPTGGGGSSGALASQRNIFCLVLLDRQTEYILCAETLSERTRWVQAFTPAATETGNERIYEDWDFPQVQAVAKYVARQPDELSLEISDIVNVFRKLSDGWYEGERMRDSERGWFPANHTIEIQNAHVRARNLRERYRLQHRQ